MAIWREILSTDIYSFRKFAKFLSVGHITVSKQNMSQEIELKFLIHSGAVTALRDVLNALPGDHTIPRPLLNIYYETPDMQLRQHDMGLRIRGVEGRYEMTMKTAGHTVGGLHQRPEYNIALAQPVLELSRFPQDMWPAGLNVAEIESQLVPLFSTNFEREKWVVTYGESRIEIALDLGEIISGEYREPLSELELELLEGRVEDVLGLAREYFVRDGLRQGSLSKAARGYHLVRGNAPRKPLPLGIVQPAAKATLEQGLIAALELALGHWQYHEELWVQGNTGAQQQVAEAVSLVRHTLALFGGVVPRKASTGLREQLGLLGDALNAETVPENLPWSTLCGGAKLALTDWLVAHRWQPFLSEAAQGKINSSFKRFADTYLSRASSELKEAFRQPPLGRYDEQLPRLARVLDWAYTLSGFYPKDARQPWLDAWTALGRAIATDAYGEIEPLRKQALAVVPFWCHSGPQ